MLVAVEGRVPGQLGQTGHRTRGSLTWAPCGGRQVDWGDGEDGGIRTE